MKLFGKTKQLPGWLAIGFSSRGAGAVHVVRAGARPAVEWTRFVEMDSTVALTLGKIGKEFPAQKYHCTTLLPLPEYQVLLVEAPKVSPAELKTAMRWRIKDMIDYHIDDATIDILAVPQEKNNPSQTAAMYAVVSPRDVVHKRVTLFEDAKILLEVVDIAEMAQRNISALFEPPGRGIAVLSFNDEGGLLTFTYGQELYLSRRIEVSWDQLQEADEANRQRLFERLVLELQRSLDHFDRQFHFVTLSKLLLVPAHDDIGLKEYLAANLYVPVESLDLNEVVDLDPELDQMQWFHLIGAALRLEEKVL